MGTDKTIHKEIVFNASQEKVWDLLTNPEMTKKYMFGCEVISTWEAGSSILWNGLTEDGKEITYVKGEVTAIDPGKLVSFTMLDPNMGIADIPENYVNMTYDLESVEGGTVLKLVQGDFSGVENGEKRYQESIGAWDMVITLMQKVMNES